MKANTSNLFIDQVLDPPQRLVWPKLGQIKGEFYLAGGTALAMQLGHRKSVDFDFFSQQKISEAVRKKVVDVFDKNIRFTMDTTDQLTWVSNEGVKVTLAYTPYAPLHPLIHTGNVSLAHVKDIASDKAFTIGRRGKYRDYVDLVFILRSGVILQTIISEAKVRYKAMFDEKLFLEQLDYMEDISDLAIEFVDRSLIFDEVRQFLHDEVEGYVKNRL